MGVGCASACYWRLTFFNVWKVQQRRTGHWSRSEADYTDKRRSMDLDEADFVPDPLDPRRRNSRVASGPAPACGVTHARWCPNPPPVPISSPTLVA